MTSEVVWGILLVSQLMLEEVRAMAIPFWIVPVPELEGHAHNHSYRGHLLFGLLQHTLHGAAPESHPEIAIGTEFSNLDN